MKKAAGYSLPTTGMPAWLRLSERGSQAVFDPDAGEPRPGDIAAIWWQEGVITGRMTQPTIVRLATKLPGWALAGPRASVVIDTEDGGLGPANLGIELRGGAGGDSPVSAADVEQLRVSE